MTHQIGASGRRELPPQYDADDEARSLSRSRPSSATSLPSEPNDRAVVDVRGVHPRSNSLDNRMPKPVKKLKEQRSGSGSNLHDVEESELIADVAHDSSQTRPDPDPAGSPDADRSGRRHTVWEPLDFSTGFGTAPPEASTSTEEPTPAKPKPTKPKSSRSKSRSAKPMDMMGMEMISYW